MEEPSKFYRYVINTTHEYYNYVKLHCEVYNLHKETPKGYWIGYGYIGAGQLRSHSHWVSKTAKKRFAYPTKEEALNNFLRRTERRVSYLESDLGNCKDALRLAKDEMNKLNENGTSKESVVS